MGGLDWKTCWTASQLGPYPVGNVAVQTDLSSAFPDHEQGAVDQSFRMILRPDIWGREARVRFSNLWGNRPVVIDGVHAGLHHGSSAVVTGTDVQLRFDGADSTVVQPGQTVWSDGVELEFVGRFGTDALVGRRLAVSFHIAGASGPMTWHASAMTTSYVSWPGAGSRGHETGEFAFPFSVNSWFFVDAVDMRVRADTPVIVCFGDSLTDGSNSTINGEDRWPDIFSRLLHDRMGDRVSVVNAGIGGNQVMGPYRHTADIPYRGGPAAIHRFEHDILSLSGVDTVVWLEGINDLHLYERSACDLWEAMTRVVTRLRELCPSIRIIGATLPSALGATLPDYGTKLQDQKRRELNRLIRSGDLFDLYFDFDAGTTDPSTGKLRDAFIPNSTRGGEGDGLHPNRLGKLSMVATIDMDRVVELLRRDTSPRDTGIILSSTKFS